MHIIWASLGTNFDDASSVEKLPNPTPRAAFSDVERARMEDEVKQLKEQQSFLETLMALQEEESKLSELMASMAIQQPCGDKVAVYGDLSHLA